MYAIRSYYGNSARSIFAEALLRDLGSAKFNAFSAGTRPGTELNAFALEVLARNGHDTSALRSKHISEFQAVGAPVIVITSYSIHYTKLYEQTVNTKSITGAPAA